MTPSLRSRRRFVACLAGSLLLLFTGDIVDQEQLEQVPTSHRRFSIQIEEGLYMVTLGDLETSDYLNHSCAPTAGMSGQIGVVALRDRALPSSCPPCTLAAASAVKLAARSFSR
mgnify:CR=1 FL=1